MYGECPDGECRDHKCTAVYVHRELCYSDPPAHRVVDKGIVGGTKLCARADSTTGRRWSGVQ